jgi:dienelactone hydrolase
VLVWPTIVNMTPAIEKRALMLAEQGYLALIGDFYGRRWPVSRHRPLATLRADVVYRRLPPRWPR